MVISVYIYCIESIVKIPRITILSTPANFIYDLIRQKSPC